MTANATIRVFWARDVSAPYAFAEGLPAQKRDLLAARCFYMSARAVGVR